MPMEATDFEKEVAAWEMFDTRLTDRSRGIPPGRPFKGLPFPAMMFRAQRIPGNGKWAVSMSAPSFFGFKDENEHNRAIEAAQAFTKSCQMIVSDEHERAKALEQGYRDEPQQAVDFMLSRERAEGNETAERNYRDRNMSAAAKAEVAKVEAETFGHVPEIPEKPRARRGRPPKSAA